MKKKQWMTGLACALCALPMTTQAAEMDEAQNVVMTADVNVTAQGYE